ncbi:hypothetical protein PENSUB_7368 [Penicillium subrubescens]|uniref:Uncharacterized protein n=1 Tax=Penicillium subrubescens TaxID=1316194 RepID=A0A1Q5TMD4_9EURO|nr:hypothetical protein PENSUB_7368 [Penicillium subrubescens]
MRKAPNQANRASGGHPGQNTGELVALDNPLAAQLLSSFETHYEAGRESRIVIQDVRPVQLSVTALGDPAHHLYEHLCALDYAGYHGPEPEWVRLLLRGDHGDE